MSEIEFNVNDIKVKYDKKTQLITLRDDYELFSLTDRELRLINSQIEHIQKEGS